jgi:DNA-binding NarL/FixJ family response regulator
MDITPGLNGLEATAEITRVAPTVLLTMFEDGDESVFAVMRAGARATSSMRRTGPALRTLR